MKIGQKVIAKTNNAHHKIGDKGEIIKIDETPDDSVPFLVYWYDRYNEWCGDDEFNLLNTKPATLEIYPYRGGFRYRKIAANGKVLNHHYNTVAGAKKGAEAERKFWENFKIIVKK